MFNNNVNRVFLPEYGHIRNMFIRSHEKKKVKHNMINNKIKVIQKLVKS